LAPSIFLDPSTHTQVIFKPNVIGLPTYVSSYLPEVQFSNDSFNPFSISPTTKKPITYSTIFFNQNAVYDSPVPESTASNFFPYLKPLQTLNLGKSCIDVFYDPSDWKTNITFECHRQLSIFNKVYALQKEGFVRAILRVRDDKDISDVLESIDVTFSEESRLIENAPNGLTKFDLNQYISLLQYKFYYCEILYNNCEAFSKLISREKELINDFEETTNKQVNTLLTKYNVPVASESSI
jgi:hypothetical protein